MVYAQEKYCQRVEMLSSLKEAAFVTGAVLPLSLLTARIISSTSATTGLSSETAVGMAGFGILTTLGFDWCVLCKLIKHGVGSGRGEYDSRKEKFEELAQRYDLDLLSSSDIKK